MAIKVSNAVDTIVGDRAVKLVNENANRTEINLWAGPDYPLWFGNEEVMPGTIGNKVEAGERVTLKLRGELWAIRAEGITAPMSFSQELSN